MVSINAVLAVFTVAILGFTYGQGASKDLFRCRQMCYQKFVQDWHHCMDFEDCKNCWNSCDENLGPFPLNINSASRQGSLVLTDIAWDQAITNASKQCLVTWEVSGGGLMGNLLTDSSTVELSLWPDTVYHVQVTCKNKETGGMRRSFKLIVDTHKLSGSSGTLQPVASMDTSMKTLPSGIFSTETDVSSESETRMKILKDSSKDFVSTYNPSYPASNTNNNHQQSDDVRTNEIPSSTESKSILRSKLSAMFHGSESDELLSRSILFAMMGSLILFLGLVLIYVMTRTKKEASMDKQGLIPNEVVPANANASNASVNRTLHV